MNSRISSSVDTHSAVVLLLPWYVNRSLEASERQLVDQHLKSCLICRRELSALRKLAVAVRQTADLQVAAEASFAGLRTKMPMVSPAQSQAAPPANGRGGLAGRNRRRVWRNASNTGKGVAIAASLLLATVSAMRYLPALSSANYYTLSVAKSEASTVGQLRVVFAKSLADADIDAVLGRIGAVRVEGPNSVGAYTVKLAGGNSSADLASAIALLRARRDVIFAEPVAQ